MVLVSADARNQTWPTAIAAPIVQRLGPALVNLPTTVSLSDAEPVEGAVLLDFLTLIDQSELDGVENLGRLSDLALAEIDLALPLVFGL